MRPVLGIETSCDETAAAVVDENGRVLASAILSQVTEHAPFGGVVPEIAARAHLSYLPRQVGHVMAESGLHFRDLGGIAVTAGPGLIGGLIVGTQFAKGLALAGRLPLIAINHLEAHALTVRLPGIVAGGAPFPYLLLLLSGGHSQCIAVTDIGCHKQLGATVDDAAGEAFDKVAKLLGLSWPGGPALEKLATEGDPNRYRFPRPMIRQPGCNMSFSGLKTAVALTVRRVAAQAIDGETLTKGQAADIAASFQQAVADVLADRAKHAIAMMRDMHSTAHLLVVAGGVASNACVRSALSQAARHAGFDIAIPPVPLCSDNAVMVAWAGMERLRIEGSHCLAHSARPRWSLEDLRERCSMG